MEQQNSKSGKTQSQIVKQQSKPISNCSDNELALLIASQSELIGFTKMPSSDLILELIDFIKEEIGKHTIAEVKYAVKLYIKGLLTLKEQHYRASARFFIELMQLYKRDYVKKAIKIETEDERRKDIEHILECYKNMRCKKKHATPLKETVNEIIKK